MPILSPVNAPYPFFTTATGLALEGGYIYIGQPGLEARTSPKASFFDKAATIPTGTASGAAIRTIGGYPVRNGAPSIIQVDGDFSITVTNSAGALVFSALTSPWSAILDDVFSSPFEFDTLAAFKADTTMTYTAGAQRSVVVGDLVKILTEDLLFSVAPSGSTTNANITAGGVKVFAAGIAVSPLHFGADPTGVADSTAAIKAAWDYCIANRIARLDIPSGLYKASSLIDLHFATSGFAPTFVMEVRMSGVIVVPASNTTGGIKFTKYSNLQHLRVIGMRVHSDALIGTEVSPTNGTAFEVYSALRPGTGGFGDSRTCEVYLENVVVGSSQPSSKGRWNRGIVLDAVWYPELVNCRATTEHPNVKTTAFYETGAGISITNCYSPILTNCYSLGWWNTNILITEDAEFAYEDFQLTGCYGINGKDGLVIRMGSAALQAAALKEPGGRISGGHFNGARYAINIENRRQFTIDGVLLYLPIGTAFRYAGSAYIRLQDCYDYIVTGNNINEGGHYVSAVDCSRHVSLEGASDFGKITNNRLGANGVAIANSSTGTNNTVSGNDFTAYPAPGNAGPTTRVIDASGLLRGGDVVVSQSPTIQFGGASVGQTYTSRDAGFVKNGQSVTFWADIKLSAKGSSTGNADIAIPNLPAPVTGSDFAFAVSYSTGAPAVAAVGGVISSTGVLQLFTRNAFGNLNTRITDADFANATEIRVSGSYVSNT